MLTQGLCAIVKKTVDGVEIAEYSVLFLELDDGRNDSLDAVRRETSRWGSDDICQSSTLATLRCRADWPYLGVSHPCSGGISSHSSGGFGDQLSRRMIA